MKNHLQRILSLLCVLALALGCASASAQTVQDVTHVLSIEWSDGDNYDGLRPTSVAVAYAGVDAKEDASEANGWTAQVTLPEGQSGTWLLDVPEGYVRSNPDDPEKDGVTIVRLYHQLPPTVSYAAEVAWNDNENAGKIRPDSVKLILLANGEPYGEPKEAKSPNYKVEWTDLPARKAGETFAIEYSVKALQSPAGYTESDGDKKVTFALQTGELKLNVSVAGYPEGTDLSGFALRVDGPDPSMPKDLTWAQVAGGSISFGSVLPGAYLVMGSAVAIEGYTMDPQNSKISDALMVKAGETATLEYKYTYKIPEAIEDVDEEYDPTANLTALSFEILGPDASLPMTVTYAQFTNGRYEIPQNLIPGRYTVVERNAESLVNYYVLDVSSVTGVAIEVAAGGTAVAKLYNKYVPAPTPEPDAEFVDVPVTKAWSDNNNKDGNRPDSVTVRLYADGVEVASHVLTAAENWNFTFTELPRYQEDNKTEIVYSVSEDTVAMYGVEINGYNLLNVYKPEVTSLSVSKHWNDNNNEANKRPASIFMTLTCNGEVVRVVELNNANGWTETVNNLPVIVNGQRAEYTWTEQTVLNYFMENVEQIGSSVIFTNKYFNPQQTAGGPQKRTGSPQYTIIGEYETALGMDVIINHVGDCFD